MSNPQPELTIVARSLGGLLDEAVFLGGAVLPLLLTDSGACPPRPTDDVDLILRIDGLKSYYEMERTLEDLGFAHDTSEDAPLCRWVVKGIRVDVMTADGKVTGPPNPWHAHVHNDPIRCELAPGLFIRCASAPTFLAAKLAAFARRGEDDFLGAHDLEDVITLVDGRSGLPGEMRRADASLRAWVAAAVRELLAEPRFTEALPAHLGVDEAARARVPLVRSRLEALAAADS